MAFFPRQMPMEATQRAVYGNSMLWLQVPILAKYALGEELLEKPICCYECLDAA